MRRRTIAVVLAVILALGAAGLVYWYTGSVKKQAGTADDSTRYVLVAKEDIPARTSGATAIQKNLAEKKAIPESLVAPGALTDASALDGRVFTNTVGKGQQIVTSQLGDPEQQSLSYEIKKGMRAVSIPIDRLRGVGGNPQAGDRVDVYATFPQDQLSQAGVTSQGVLPPATPTTKGNLLEAQPVVLDTSEHSGESATTTTGVVSSVTKLLLQQVEVLAIDRLDSSAAGLTGKDESPKNPVVVLMVEPQDVERLVFAQEIGSIWLALVPAEDSETVVTPGRVLTNVFR